MKTTHYILFLFLLLTLLNLLSCANGPSIKFENEEYNFGEVEEGKNIDITFTFQNTGKEILILKDVKPTCSCTVINDWDKTIEPGKSGKIFVTLNTANYQGDIIKVVNVTTNIPKRATINLTITGKINPPLVEVIPRDIFLAEVNSETKKLYGTFEIVSHLNVPLQIKEVLPPSDLKTEYTITVLKDKQNFRIDFIVYAPFIGKGTVKNSFMVITDYTKIPEIPLNFYYTIP